MRIFRNFVGEVFGDLKVLSRTDQKIKYLHRLYQCVCIRCNKESLRTPSGLNSKTSCPHCRIHFKDHSGEITRHKITLLSVDEENPRTKGGQVRWKCRCHCGKVFSISAYNIKTQKSCGCSKTITDDNYKGTGNVSENFLTRIKYDANKRKREFNLTTKYLWNLFIKQKSRCNLSGAEIYLPKFCRYWVEEMTASLDRIDSNKGYVKGNVQWVHKDVNFMKQELSQERFIEYCKAIAKHNS